MKYGGALLDEFFIDRIALSNGQTVREFVLAEGSYIRTVRTLNDILASRGIERLSDEELEAARKIRTDHGMFNGSEKVPHELM